MKKTLITFAAFLAAAFTSVAASLDTYTEKDFAPVEGKTTHELKLKTPIKVGAEDWTVKVRAKVGEGYYVDKNKQSWGSTLVAVGKNPFPEYYDFKPFQVFVGIENDKDATHRWGGIPRLNEEGKATIDAITYVLCADTEQIREESQKPVPGETWIFIVKYEAANQMLSCTAYDETKGSKFTTSHKRMASRLKDATIDTLSTSVIGLDGWELESLSVNIGNAPEPNKTVQALLIAGGVIAVVVLLGLIVALRRKKA